MVLLTITTTTTSSTSTSISSSPRSVGAGKGAMDSRASAGNPRRGSSSSAAAVKAQHGKATAAAAPTTGADPRGGQQSSSMSRSSSASSSASASASSSSTNALLRRGEYKFSLGPAPVRFPSRPTSLIDVDGTTTSMGQGATGATAVTADTAARQPKLSAGNVPSSSLTGGGVHGGASTMAPSKSTPSISNLGQGSSIGRDRTLTAASSAQGSASASASSSSLSSTAAGAAAGASSSASVAAFAPAPRPPTDRARPPNAASVAGPRDDTPASDTGQRGGEDDARARTRSGGLAALRAILGIGGRTREVGEGAPHSHTGTDKPADTSSSSIARNLETRLSGPSDRRTAHTSQRVVNAPSGAQAGQARGQGDQSRPRYHSAAAGGNTTRSGPVAGSMPMSRPNSKILTSFPFPHPVDQSASNSFTASAASLGGYVLRSSPRSSPTPVDGRITSSSSAAAALDAAGHGAGGVGRDAATRQAAAGKAMQHRLAQGNTADSSSNKSRPIRRSLGALGAGLGLGFGFGASKSRDKLPDDSSVAAAAVDKADPSRTGALADNRRQSTDPETGQVPSTADGSSAGTTPLDAVAPPNPFLPAPAVGTPSLNPAPSSALPSGPSSPTFAQGLTTLARLPLTLFVPTLPIDWGSLPFGLGERKRRQVEDEENAREAEAIMAAQARLFEQRRIAGAMGAGAGMGGGSDAVMGASKGQGAGLGTVRPPSVRAAPNYGAIEPDSSADAVLPTDRRIAGTTDKADPRRRSFLAVLGLGRDHSGANTRDGDTNADSPPQAQPPVNNSSHLHRQSGISLASTSSDPLDPYGYRSLAGPTLLPSHAEYVERRKIAQRRAAAWETTRRIVRRVTVGVIGVLVLGLLVWLLGAWIRMRVRAPARQDPILFSA